MPLAVLQNRRKGMRLRVTTEDMKTTSPVRTGQKNCERMRLYAEAKGTNEYVRVD
jgi:hypothetical protein